MQIFTTCHVSHHASRSPGSQPGPEGGQRPADINAGLGALMSGAVATLGGPLQAIKEVKVKDLVLDSLVPNWLLFACHHFTSLRLTNCQFAAVSAPSVSIPTHTQLRHLHLAGLSYDVSEQPAFSRWQHQLRALPGLQHLGLDTGDGWQHGAERWLECCAAVGAQLTHLEYLSQYVGPMSDHLPPQVAAWYPSLCTLYLPNLMVTDDSMEALLGLHRLKRFECCEFELEHSYTHRPWTWTHLHVGLLAIDQITRLPLESVRWLEPTHDGITRCAFTIVPSSNPQATSSALAAIMRCGGLSMARTGSVYIDMEGLSDVTAIPPLLAGCKATCLVFGVAHVTPELLTALQPTLALSVCPRLSCVRFDDCDWTHPQVCGLVVANLPEHISHLVLHAKGGALTELQFIEICLAARRPIKVTVADGNDEWAVGWEQRVATVTEAAPEGRTAGSFVLTIKGT